MRPTWIFAFLVTQHGNEATLLYCPSLSGTNILGCPENTLRLCSTPSSTLKSENEYNVVTVGDLEEYWFADSEGRRLKDCIFCSKLASTLTATYILLS